MVRISVAAFGLLVLPTIAQSQTIAADEIYTDGFESRRVGFEPTASI
jgi:hypothetical protein